MFFTHMERAVHRVFETFLRPRSAATLLVAALAACASQDPTALSKLASTSALPGVQASWHFGNQHYRDHGSHESTASSGSAGITAEALFSSDGTTQLAVTSFRNGRPGVNAGTIDRLLIKFFDASGKLLSTQNIKFGGASVFHQAFNGLAPGFTIELQVQVSGLDHAREDVVRLTGLPVVRRPDLAIIGLTLPSIAISGTPTLITATIAELNGGHGATTSCVLNVDGVSVDRADGIWVDAGDVVSCAFTWTFPSTGPHEAQVHLSGTNPMDDNTRNNARAGILNVVAPSSVAGAPAVTFDGSIQSGTFASVDSFRTVWTDPTNGFLFLDAHDYETQSGSTQSAMLSGVIGSKLTFPLARIDLAQTTGGRLLAQASYTSVPTDNPGNADCIARGVGSGVEFYLCSDPGGFTTFTYLRATGTVTYASDQYQKLWNGSSYDITPYVANGTSTTGLFATLGADFTLDVRITDASGSYVTTAVMPLSPYNVNQLQPSICATSPVSVPPATYSAHTCVYSSYVFNGVIGGVSGTGSTTSPGTSATP